MEVAWRFPAGFCWEEVERPAKGTDGGGGAVGGGAEGGWRGGGLNAPCACAVSWRQRVVGWARCALCGRGAVG